jgi:hypothetical protein
MSSQESVKFRACPTLEGPRRSRAEIRLIENYCRSMEIFRVVKLRCTNEIRSEPTFKGKQIVFTQRHKKGGFMGTILLIILILLLVGALPTWPYSSGWGYYPSGGLGLILLILVILLVMGRI